MQFNTYLKINQIKTKKCYLTLNCSTHRHLERSYAIAKSPTSSDFCSHLLPLIHIEKHRRIRNDSAHLMMDIIFSDLSPVLLVIFWAICL